MKTRHSLLIFVLLLLPACERNGKNEWENLDYSRIARDNYHRENDQGYTPPTITGCVDDDLYNCPTSRGYH